MDAKPAQTMVEQQLRHHHPDSAETTGKSRIVIRRVASRWQDRLRDYKVVVDGRVVARVANGREVTVAVEPGRHKVHMAIDWARSRPLDVELTAEQSIRLECGPNVPPLLALIYVTVLFRRWVWLRPATDAAS